MILGSYFLLIDVRALGMIRHSWGQIFMSLLIGATVGAELLALLHYYMGKGIMLLFGNLIQKKLLI